MFFVGYPRSRCIVDCRSSAHDGIDSAIKEVGYARIDPA
jgi:hypothetical protein